MKHMIFVILAMLLICGSTLAQIDQHPNGMGIYFDEEATINGIYVDAPIVVHAYLVITNCTLENGISHWWGGLICSTSYYAELRGDCYNEYSNTSDPAGWVQFNVFYNSPILIQPIIIVADIWFEVNDSAALLIYLAEHEGSTYSHIGCKSDGQIVYLDPSTGCGEMPPCFPAWVASINYVAPIASEQNTLGGVKALYR